MKKLFLFAGILSIVFCLCYVIVKTSGNTDNTDNTASPTPSPEQQLNISILLDLSDRINNPLQFEKDTALVNYFVEYVKKDIVDKKIIGCKDKIKVFFTPLPDDPDIENRAKKLRVDLSAMPIKEKKLAYHDMSQIINSNLNAIYSNTLSSHNWIGCDIWSFFKDDVDKLCIDKDPSYRNILVILTDGYVYYDKTMINDKNKHSYIIGKDLINYRNSKSEWKTLIDKNNYGLIPHNKDLSKLEILTLELSSTYPANPYEEDMLGYVLEKWYKEMGVKRCATYKTGLTIDTKVRIDDFLSN